MASVAIHITSDGSSVTEDLFLPDGRGLPWGDWIIGAIVMPTRIQWKVVVSRRDWLYCWKRLKSAF